jgi:hypothetical protein
MALALTLAHTSTEAHLASGALEGILFQETGGDQVAVDRETPQPMRYQATSCHHFPALSL